MAFLRANGCSCAPTATSARSSVRMKSRHWNLIFSASASERREAAVAEKLSPRPWATKLIIGAFLLMAVTGVLMFFELEHGFVVVVHQWASWILLIGAAG